MATAEGAQMPGRRHLAAAPGEIVSITEMLAGEAPFIDHLPTRTPEGGITCEMKAALRRTLSVRRREPEESD